MHFAPAAPRPDRFAFSDTRRWVLIGTSIGTVAYGLLAAVHIASNGWQPASNQILLLVAALASTIGGLVARRGFVFAGGMTAIVGCWCEFMSNLLTTSEFPSPSLLAAAPVLVASTLLLRPRHSAIFALVTVAGTWPVVLLSPALQATGLTSATLYWLTSHSVVTMAVWSLVTLGFSIVDRAFVEVVRKERALAETINKAPDGILVLDVDGMVQMTNPAAEALLDVRGDACVGRPIAEVIRRAGPKDADALPLADAHTDERARSMSFERADGQRMELDVTWRAMEGGRRQLVLRDVSERVRADQARREMETQLAHSQRLEAVGQLAGGIAHDFNNILTIVGASAEVMRAEMTDDRFAPLLDDIMAAQERGATLTRQLLAFARREVVQPLVFDLSAHVLTLRRLLQRVAGEQARISCDVEPDCRIRADVGQMEQALVNLVSNARDAMPDGGTCHLSVVRMTNDDGDTWVRVRVTDEGHGMDAATQARAFEPFFTTKPRGRGTGLGLAAVHGMVLQSGGRADIESKRGKGTSVILEFPFAMAPAALPVAETPAVRQGNGAMILVAEDDDGTRATVARMLGRLGHSVILAPDGQQALRLAEQHADRIDLLLTDVMMPGMSGPQLTARLRARGQMLPVIFMSGYPEDALAEAEGLCIETDFLPKPFTSAVLSRKVTDKVATSPRAATPD